MTELAARVMQNDVARHNKNMSQARFLLQHGWENAGPTMWSDWLTGQTFPVAKAYHMELSRWIVKR